MNVIIRNFCEDLSCRSGAKQLKKKRESLRSVRMTNTQDDKNGTMTKQAFNNNHY
ncbi:MAG: hypothetical protein IKJ97_02800 [Bacteroidaceae bacterium]|nr:hypothetical protein [Bacteroidaceae bacterium]